MAIKTSRGLRGLLAAFAAVLIAFAALPTTALAAYTTQSGDITVSNVHPGETVTLYQVVKYEYKEANNTVDWSFTADFGIDRVQYRDAEDNGDAIKGFANTMASYVLNPVNNFSAALTHEETVGGISCIQVHPTYLYESVWCLLVLACMLLYRTHKKFDGEVFLLYLALYGAGRFWIEGLRTDQLLIPGTEVPVSQLLAGVLVIVSAVWILCGRRGFVPKKKQKKTE